VFAVVGVVFVIAVAIPVVIALRFVQGEAGVVLYMRFAIYMRFGIFKP